MRILSNIFRIGSIAAAIWGVIAILMVARLQAQKQMPATTTAPKMQPPAKPFTHSVSTTGILEALSENVSIGAPEAGIVAKVDVKVNDEVKTGQTLFSLDDRNLQAEALATKSRISIATANVAVAESQLAKTRSQLTRLEAVTDPRAISLEDLQNGRIDVDVASAKLQSACAELNAAESDLARNQLLIDRLTVKSPRDGTILQVNIRTGEYAATSPKNPLMIIGDTERLQVRADVDEQNASRIAADQTARASLKGEPNVTFPLEFVRVEPYVIPKMSLTGASTERVDTRVLQVIFSMKKPASPPVYVGQQVDVFIEAPEISQP